MGNLNGNITLGMNLRYTNAGVGSQGWSVDASHSRAVVPGSGAGKVDQACVKVLSIGLIASTINLKELPMSCDVPNKAVQDAGGPDISRMAGLVIKNTSLTATVTVSKPGSNGFIGLTATLPPGGAVAIDFNAGLDMGTAVNLVFQSTANTTPVELYALGNRS